MSIEQIRDRYDSLTAKQRSIVDFMLSRPEDVCYLSLEQLSSQAGASEVSVLRLCAALGYENYIDLREDFRRHSREILRDWPLRRFLPKDIRAKAGQSQIHRLKQVCESDLRNLFGMMNALDINKFFACVDALMKANEVLVFAHDGSRIFAEYLCYRLNFLMIKAVSVKLGDDASVEATLSRLSPEDLVVLLSFPPYYHPIYDVGRYSRYRGSRVITITDSMESPGAVDESLVFICPTTTHFHYNSQVATSSFINILCACVAAEMGGRYDEILAEQQLISDFMSSRESVE